MGTAQDPVVMINPLTLQVAAFPTAQGDCGVPDGGAKGPVMRARDCKMSEMLSPKMMRLYGVARPVGEVRIITAMVDEANSDTEDVQI